MAEDSDPLATYRQKRNFDKSPEPDGHGGSGSSDEPRFVVQKHAARSLHYDFRLEIGGVLKSWAVPKGPATDPRAKRLASPTEDHPLDYLEFEGVIPAGEYGAGPVIVWDIGTYRNATAKRGEEVAIEKALEQGHLVVRLNGSKLRGGYALTRTASGRNERWLLVKTNDDDADPDRDPVTEDPNSALSGQSLEDLQAGRR